MDLTSVFIIVGDVSCQKGNNEGSVYKDKRGRWTGSVTLPSVNGKVRKKYFYGKTKKEVSDKFDSLF